VRRVERCVVGPAIEGRQRVEAHEGMLRLTSLAAHWLLGLYTERDVHGLLAQFTASPCSTKMSDTNLRGALA
jgi:hypothetical protein